MKKTFPLHAPGKADQRVVEGIKHDVRKYVKRERAKTLPEGFDLWEFHCKVGDCVAAAAVQPLNDVGSAIDAVVAAGATAVYIEILAAAGHRIPRVATPPVAAADATPAEPGASAPPAPHADVPPPQSS